MPAQNQNKDSYLGRQSRIARPESSHVNRIFDESVNSPYKRRRVQVRAECQKRGGQSLFEYDSNSRLEPQDESPSHMPRLAWGDIQSKEATNKALDKANLVASKDQMNAARRLMASASFAGELGLEWVFWPETEPYKLSNAIDSCWEMVQNDAARTAEDTIPIIEELLARNVRDYLTEKRNQFRCFCSEQVQGLLPVARHKDGEDHFVFWKNLTDDFKILCKPPKDGVVPLDNEGRQKRGYRMFLSDIVVRCLAYFWSRQYNHYHKFPLVMKAGWFDPFNGHTIVHTCANIMWAAMERRDNRHRGVRKQDSSDANPLFQAIKANWLDLDSDKQRRISNLLTYKVKRLTEFALGENEIEAAPNDFRSNCQDLEQDSDYEEANKGSTLRHSYQKCRSSQADGYHHSQPIRLDVLENVGPGAISHASSSKGFVSTPQGLSKLRDTDKNTSKSISKRAWEVMAKENPMFGISKSPKTKGDQKWPPLLVTRVFDEDEEGLDIPDSLRTEVKRTANWIDWCTALEGSPSGVYRWALERDWTFELPAIEAANEPEVQTIQCYADLRAMLKHVGNDSIIVYHPVNYESTDEKELGGSDIVAHKEGLPSDTDGSDEEIMFH